MPLALGLGLLVVGWAVVRLHSWTIPFYITGIVYLVGAIAWLGVDSRQRIAG